MPIIEPDTRSADRRAGDERIAAEPELAPLELPLDAVPSAMESHLRRRRHPLAVVGVVENGLIRCLDPAVALAEHSRVIIVTSECD